MGTGNVAIAHVIVLLEKYEDDKRLAVAVAMLNANNHVNNVVKDVKIEKAPTKN